jgi:hypothetical protein
MCLMGKKSINNHKEKIHVANVIRENVHHLHIIDILCSQSHYNFMVTAPPMV